MSGTREQANVFDPALSAKLHNKILELGWNAVDHDLTFEQAAPGSWWDENEEECRSRGITARLHPKLIKFLKLARVINPSLRNSETGYDFFFYYTLGLAPPVALMPDNPELFGNPDQHVILYHVPNIGSHPVGVVFDQSSSSVRVTFSLWDDKRTPWLSLQSLLQEYLDMTYLVKATAGESETDEEESNGEDEEEDDIDIDMETDAQFTIEANRPWALHSHSPEILDRTIAAFANLIGAIQDRMPNRDSSTSATPTSSR
ncbi:hypothetical protein BKA67DRAFT_662014 [Truncatella angustata]|uniref:Uncharacterized protein n=1 Tax=Truncatella angustata TaxID=152316 RepID=A0A9P8UFM1_9PEZI|nr:uncharacterized protein BKA67DRAFT_662014 [Truncatella angustata]KAH6649095.1 hypothetical protein BKA67DRAFT_662014 [Truncatella angustata]